MSSTATEPATNWNGTLTDIAWILEWAERFPHDGSDAALDWARSEIARIGRHLDALPAVQRLAMPSEDEYLAAMDAVQLS